MSILIGTPVDAPSALPAPRPPLMKRMCCDRLPDGDACALVLGWVVCVPDVSGETFHGYCLSCYDRAKRELDELISIEGETLENLLDDAAGVRVAARFS